MPLTTTQQVIDALKNKLGDKGWTLLDINEVPATDMNGHVSKRGKVFARIGWGGGRSDETHEFYLKVAAYDAGTADCIQRYFVKERFVLTKVIPVLEASVRGKLTCACYYAENELFILEDLTSLDYNTCRLPSFDMDHSMQAVKVLSKFHAASFILEKSSNKLVQDMFPGLLFETMFTLEDKRSNFRASLERFRFIARYLKKYSDETINSVIERASKRLGELCKPSEKFMNVICSGDPWGNNILFKYENDKPVDALLLDFQTSRVAPPAMDLVFFLYTAFFHEVQGSQTESLLQFYYGNLSDTLKGFHISLESVLPWSVFREAFDYYSREFGTPICAFYSLGRIPKHIKSKITATEETLYNAVFAGDVTFLKEAMDTCESYRQLMCDAATRLIGAYN